MLTFAFFHCHFFLSPSFRESLRKLLPLAHCQVSFCPSPYWKRRARSKEINVEALHNTQGLHTMERGLALPLMPLFICVS